MKFPVNRIGNLTVDTVPPVDAVAVVKSTEHWLLLRIKSPPPDAVVPICPDVDQLPLSSARAANVNVGSVNSEIPQPFGQVPRLPSKSTVQLPHNPQESLTVKVKVVLTPASAPPVVGEAVTSCCASQIVARPTFNGFKESVAVTVACCPVPMKPNAGAVYTATVLGPCGVTEPPPDTLQVTVLFAVRVAVAPCGKAMIGGVTAVPPDGVAVIATPAGFSIAITRSPARMYSFDSC